MPELPDVTLHVEALAERLVGHALTGYAIRSPFVLRTVDPSLDALVGVPLAGVRRLGKRIVLELDGELFLVVHLMIAGRFRRTRSRIAPGSHHASLPRGCPKTLEELEG
jgi:formamidopyrimidine-DNA glycosylase